MPTAAGATTPGMGRRKLSLKQEDGREPVAANSREKDANTKFGAVKVYAGLLSQALDVKTYVITNNTTAKELVSIVTSSYKALCVDDKIFYLTLERLNRRAGSATQKAIKLHESAKPLEMQSRYPRGDTKFNLQLKPGCGVLTVNDKCIVAKSPSRSVFASDQTTCAEVIGLILKTNKLESSVDKFAVYEVEVNSKLSQELKLGDRPLVIQKQRLDSFEYFFQVRDKKQSDPKRPIRRNHSLEDLSGGHRKVLNYKELKKSLIPRRRQWNQRPASGGLTKSTSVDQLASAHLHTNDSTLDKLKDSVGKLRKHLDNISSRRMSLPGGENIMSDLSDDTSAFATGSRHIGRAVSHDCINHNHVAPGERNGSGGSAFRSISRDSTARHEEVTGYDTGSSLNESDAGSGPAAAGRKLRGSQDSAYSSDRVSYSSYHKTRRKKPTQQDSGESSPEGPQNLTKSQSLIDLKSSNPPEYRGLHRPKPTRINYSEATPTMTRKASRAANCGSEENLNSWSRMKQYDTSRRLSSGPPARREGKNGEDDPAASVPDLSKGTGTPEDVRSVSSPTSSMGRSRARRTLPQVPAGAGATTAALEEKKRRMSQAALVKARMDKDKRESVEGWLGATVPATTSPLTQLEDGDFNEHIASSLYQHSSTPSGSGKMEAQGSASLRDPPPYPSKSDFRPIIPHGNHGDPNPPSQEALQRIISDLRDAANKPIEPQPAAPTATTTSTTTTAAAAVSHRERDDIRSRSSGSSLSRDPDPQQLNTTYDKRRSSLEMALNPVIPTIPASPPPSTLAHNGYVTTNGGDTTYAKTRGSGSLNQDALAHPTLNSIIKCCELHDCDIARDARMSHDDYFGIEIFDSTYSGGDQHDGVFRSPAGRKALIGRGRGAFQPVASANTDSSPVLSLAAVSFVRDGSAAYDSILREGDFIIEVNGGMVNNLSAEEVRHRIYESHEVLHLVIARRNKRNSLDGQGMKRSLETNVVVKKDFEKLKLKYQSLKQDTEKHMDTIAELRLDLLDREKKIEEINTLLLGNDDHLFQVQIESQRKEEKISEWKLEANNRNIEIARLKFDAQQREIKIEQLRKLLIQQNEVMHLEENGFGDYDDLYEGEHVSAV